MYMKIFQYFVRPNNYFAEHFQPNRLTYQIAMILFQNATMHMKWSDYLERKDLHKCMFKSLERRIH